MKVRTQILSAILAGAVTACQGVGVLAAEPLVQPVDDVPGEFVINRINLDANELTVTYIDTGTDVETALRLAISYVNDGRDVPLEEWTQISYPYYMTRIYDKSAYDSNHAQLVSGQAEVIAGTQMYNGAKLADNTDGKLYYGLAVLLVGNDNVVRSIMGKIDYSKCLAMYETGVECVREESATGKVIYAPYLNGERLQMPDEDDDNDDGNNGNNNDNNDNDGGNNDNGNENDNGGDNGGDNGNNGGSGDGNGNGENDNNGEDNNDSGGDSDNSGESGGESSGNGAETTTKTDNSDDHWTGTRDPGNGLGGQDSTSWDVSTAWYAGAGDAGGVMLATEAASDMANINETTSDDNSSAQIEVKTSGKSETVEVPDLGGGETEKQAGKAIYWWIIVPVVVGVAGLLSWWLVPILRKRKQKESEN